VSILDTIEEMIGLPEFTQGVAEDGTAILKGGEPMTVEEILNALNTLALLYQLKVYKEEYGKTEFYVKEREEAWYEAREALRSPQQNDQLRT